MNEEIILGVTIDRRDAEQQLKAVTAQLAAQKAEVELLHKAMKNVNGLDEESIKLKNAIAKNLEIQKQQTSKLSAEQKSLVTLINAEEKSVDSLNAQNKILIAQRNKLNTETDEGRAAIAKYNAQIDANTEKIKANVSAGEVQRMNIGNYAAAVDKLIPGLGGLASRTVQLVQANGGLVNSLKAVGVQLWALVANPIVAVIALIVLGLAALYKGFTSTAAGADLLDDVIAGVSATIKVIIDRLGQLALGLKNILTGNFSEGFKQLGSAVSGVADEIEREVRAAVALEQALRDLEDAEIDYRVAAGNTQNEIKRLLLLARNRSKTEEERLGFLEAALVLEKQLNDERLKNATEDLRIANEQAAMRLNLVRVAGESEIDYSKRILLATRADNAAQIDDERNKMLEKLAVVQQVEGELIDFEGKLQNQRDALEDKAEEKRKKLEEARLKAIEKLKQEEQKALEEHKKRLEEQRKWDEEEYKWQTEQQKKLREEALANIELETQRRILALTLQMEQELALETESAEWRELIYKDYNDVISIIQREGLESRLEELRSQGLNTVAVEQQIADMRIKEAERVFKANQAIKEKEKQAEMARLVNLKNWMVAGVAITREGTVANKFFASSAALINTYLAASEALKNPPGPPYTIPLMITAIATGLKNVAAINGIAAAGGADFTTTGPTLLLVGDNPGGVEHVSVTPISGKGQTKTFSSNNIPGVAMAGGGSIQVNNAARQNRQAQQSIEAAQNTKVVLLMQDFDYAREAQISPITKAEVLP